MVAPADALADRVASSLTMTDAVAQGGTTDLTQGAATTTNTASAVETAAADSAAIAAGPALHPDIAAVRGKPVEDILREMNRMPLFMTELDESDGADGENEALEAIRALAYEGTRAEIAGNFRESGNEQARLRRWVDAQLFYDKALAALKAPPHEQPEMEVAEKPDPVEEAKKEREIEEACYANRALCHLERKNYRSCNLDCAATLRINPRNVKAWYRSASACLALDKIPQAADACARGLEVDAANAQLKALSEKIKKREEHLAALEQARREREERQRAEANALQTAFRKRGIRTRTTAQAPEMEDAAIKLETVLDPSSTLSFPVVLLYPVHLQSDFVKAFRENETLADHLAYILPLPWDEQAEYKLQDVECYIETAAGGLIKAGKKLPLLKLLEGGKVEVVDGLVRVNVVPKAHTASWIEEFKKRRRT